MAFQAVKANKMRSFLTMLGIIIGISAVIAIQTVGDSLTKSVTSSFESFGANNIMVGVTQRASEETRGDSGFSFMGPRYQKQPTRDDYITQEMLDEFMNNFSDEVTGLAINVNLAPSGVVSRNGNSVNVSAIGANDSALDGYNLDILAGTKFGTKAQKGGKGVCLVSDYLVKKLFKGDNEAAIGQKIEIVSSQTFYKYTIVGVYEYSSDGSLMGGNDDITTDLYVPLKSAQDHTRVYGFKSFTAVKNTESSTSVDDLMKQIEHFFDRYYRKNNNFEVTTSSMASMIDSLTTMLKTMSVAISVIAGISLLVGGVGVMNIMLVSISERTREIGTRKALGATNSSIRMQFVIESIVLCLIGGAIGVILGILGGSFAGSKVLAAMELDAAVAISPSSVILAVSVSLAIGVFFGYYPANKAAKMNPIDALRYE